MQTIEGKLESMVMNIVWTKQICSAKDVLSELNGTYALTTISTILDRLTVKGVVMKTKKGGKVIFSPKISQKSYSETIVKRFMEKITLSFGDLAVSSFAKGVQHLPAEKRKELVELLKSYED